MSVTTLHPPKASIMTPTARAANALWFRLNQAQAVALCISDKCDVLDAQERLAALAQIMALSGAVAELLALALSDVEALEALH